MFRRVALTASRFGTSIARRQLPRVTPAILQNPTVARFPIRSYSISTQGDIIDDQIDNITDGEYSKISNEYLETISDSLEELSESFEQVDAELNHGVLTLVLPPHGTYVINKQPPNKQIWLSSPVSGPKRYDLIGGKWRTLRDGSLLTELLEQEISEAVGEDFKFDGIEQ
ncbi:YFH1 Frataxin [Candida maltosa Xu316]